MKPDVSLTASSITLNGKTQSILTIKDIFEDTDTLLGSPIPHQVEAGLPKSTLLKQE